MPSIYVCNRISFSKRSLIQSLCHRHEIFALVATPHPASSAFLRPSCRSTGVCDRRLDVNHRALWQQVGCSMIKHEYERVYGLISSSNGSLCSNVSVSDSFANKTSVQEQQPHSTLSSYSVGRLSNVTLCSLLVCCRCLSDLSPRPPLSLHLV